MGNSTSARKEEDVESIRVDGGHVVPQGVYPNSLQDYDHTIVRKLIIERKLCPFYKGLADPDETAEHTTTGVMSVSQSSVPVSPMDGPPSTSAQPSSPILVPSTSSPNMPLRSPSSHSLHMYTTPPEVRMSNTSFRDTLKSRRSQSSKQLPPPIDMNLLYKFAIECPICFLYYPRNMNYTRCCDKPICTECFVQIKRSDQNCDPAECPFCVEPHMGIVYAPPGTCLADILQSHSTPPQSIPFSSSVPNMSMITSTPSFPGSCSIPSSFKAQHSLMDSSTIESNLPRSTVVQNEEGKKRKPIDYKHPQCVTSDHIRPDLIQHQKQLALAREASSSQRSRLASRIAMAQASGRNIAPELTSAAHAAASLAETMSSLGLDGSHSRNRRNGRSRRRPQPHAVALIPEYLDAMRMLGPDLEELMVMEAMRLSLQESEQAPESSQVAPESSQVAPESSQVAASPIEQEDSEDDRVLADLVPETSSNQQPGNENETDAPV